MSEPRTYLVRLTDEDRRLVVNALRFDAGCDCNLDSEKLLFLARKLREAEEERRF